MNVSRKIYTDLDLQGNCLLSFRLPIYDEEPELIVGSIYYNPLIKEVYFGYEDGWQPFGTGVGDVVLGNYVDLTSSQIISGNKIFEGGLQTAALYISDSGHSIYDDSDVLVIQSVADMMVLATGHAIDMYGDIFKFNDSDVITSAGGIITGLTQFLATVNLEGRLDFHQGVIASLGPVDGKFAITTDSLTITGFTEIDEGLTVRGVGITTGGITLSASDVSHNIFDDGGDLAIETDYAIVLSGNGLTYNGYDVIHEGNCSSYISQYTYSKSEINNLISGIGQDTPSALDKLLVSDGSTAVLVSGTSSDISVGIYGKTNISGSLHVLSGIFNVTEDLLTYKDSDVITSAGGIITGLTQFLATVNLEGRLDFHQGVLASLGPVDGKFTITTDSLVITGFTEIDDGLTVRGVGITTGGIILSATDVSHHIFDDGGDLAIETDYAIVLSGNGLTYNGYDIIHEGNGPSYMSKFTYSKSEINDLISALDKLSVSDGSTAVLASGTLSDIVVGIYGKTNISGSLHVLSGIFNVTESILTYNGYDIIHKGNGPSYMSQYTYSKSEIDNLISGLGQDTPSALDKLLVSDGSTAVLASGTSSDIVVGIYGKTNISGSLHVLSGIFNVTDSILTYKGYTVIHTGNAITYLTQYTYSRNEIDDIISNLSK